MYRVLIPRLFAYLACAVLPAHAMAEAPDLILTNGKIVTVDDQFSIQSALAIKGERIVAVGTAAEIAASAGPATRTMDLGGRTVVPGMIDTHSHLIRASQLWKHEVRLDGVMSRKEALRLVKERVKTLKPGAWVMNMGGWAEEQFLDDPRGFTLEELDAIAPRNPVYLDVNYSHRYVNSAFLRLAGLPIVNKNVVKKPPTPGAITTEAKGLTEDLIERDANGRATGKVVGGAYGNALALSMMPMVEGEEGVASLKAAVSAANAVGLTAIYDGGGVGVREDAYERARQLAAKNELTLRVFRARQELSRTPEQAEQQAKAISAIKPFAGNDYYDMIGIGEIIYTPAHDGYGNPTAVNEDNRRALTALFEAAARGGWNSHLHAVHGQSMNFALDIMDEVATKYPLRSLRWMFVHADLLDRATLERARRYNMGMSMRSYTTLTGWDAIRKVVGDRYTQVPDLRTIQDSGVLWTFGSEAPRITVLSPFASLAWAVNGRRFFDKERVLTRTVTREEALIAHTRNGAYQVFRENSLGQIKSGYLADLVVLNKDYLRVTDDELFSIEPVMTLVGGKVVHSTLASGRSAD
jgi:predicted amidohydrolase YtcJ